jgi:hypothetical protein
MPWIRTRHGITEHFTREVPLPTRHGTAMAICGAEVHGPLAAPVRGRHGLVYRCSDCLDQIEGPLRAVVERRPVGDEDDMLVLDCSHQVRVPREDAPPLFAKARCSACRDLAGGRP